VKKGLNFQSWEYLDILKHCSKQTKKKNAKKKKEKETRKQSGA